MGRHTSLDMETVDALAAVKPLAKLVPSLKHQFSDYKVAVEGVVIDHTENKEDHSFTEGVLAWWASNGSKVPAWGQAAQIVFAFTPNSAAPERVFSLLKAMFGGDKATGLADYVQTALMLKYNKRTVG